MNYLTAISNLFKLNKYYNNLILFVKNTTWGWDGKNWQYTRQWTEKGGIQTYIQTDRQTDRHTDRQTDRQAGRQHILRQKNRHTETNVLAWNTIGYIL